MKSFLRMKIPSACVVGILIIAVVGVSSFSTTKTTTMPSPACSISRSRSMSRTAIFAEEEGKETGYNSEELTRRKMLAARLQIQKHDAATSTDDEEDGGSEGTATTENYETVLEAARRGMLGSRLKQEQPNVITEEVAPAVEEKEEVAQQSVEEDEVEDETVAPTSGAYFADTTPAPAKEDEDEVEAETVAPTTSGAYFADTTPAPATSPSYSAGAATSSSITKSTNNNNDDSGIKLDIIATIAKDVAVDVLSLLRFGAANFLTSSLPEDQRQDLLRRMGAPTTVTRPTATTTTTATDSAREAAKATEMAEQQRASVQEEIAVARAEEAQKNEKRWDKEKEEIIGQMEEAANDRVKNELEVQKMRLEQEQEQALKEREEEEEEEKKRLASMKEENEKEVSSEEQHSDDKLEVNDLFVGETAEEEERNRQLKSLFEKRKKQQLALESIEDELRLSVANEAEERERLQSLLEKRKGQQTELSAVEETLRNQVVEIEAEKLQFKQLLTELETMKEKEQQLQQEPSKTATEEENATEEKGETPYYSPKEYRALSEEDKAKVKRQRDGVADDSDDEDSITKRAHPVLGPVVADIGYKRLHFVSAGRLGTIPVWNRNRIYRNNRAKSMAAEKFKSMELGFPGAICLHEDTNGKLSIVDGQHRVGMMAALRETINKKLEKGEDVGAWNAADSVFEQVLVEVYPEPTQNSETTATNDDKFAEKVFLEINKAEPVKLIDMPGVASAADRKVITDAVEALQEKYSHMFSPSQRCRVPNVNMDNLRSSIFGANILKRHKLTTSKQLLDWLFEQNAALGEQYENSEEKQKIVSGKQWSKASKNNFYLGLESSWLYK